MAFDPVTNAVPTAIGTILITLKDTPAIGEQGASKSADFRLTILDAAGEIMTTRQGNLVPHISTTDRDWLLDFAARMRTQAEEQILP